MHPAFLLALFAAAATTAARPVPPADSALHGYVLGRYAYSSDCAR